MNPENTIESMSRDNIGQTSIAMNKQFSGFWGHTWSRVRTANLEVQCLLVIYFILSKTFSPTHF